MLKICNTCRVRRRWEVMRRRYPRCQAAYLEDFRARHLQSNRNAIVMRRMENEHGCTLSSRDETTTSGRSQTPPLLAFQMIVEAVGLTSKQVLQE